MRTLRNLVIILLFLGLPATLLADVTVGGLPETAKWYFHADFEEMRSSDAGKHLYGWLQDEVFSDIREDVGVDLDKEADTVTAYSAPDDGIIVVIAGNISQETKDKMLAVGAASGSLDKLGSGSKHRCLDGRRNSVADRQQGKSRRRQVSKRCVVRAERRTQPGASWCQG
jgi:hypothetical protein